jgi:pyridoxine/pyridoxamine 5'-phosphate oxidase
MMESMDVEQEILSFIKQQSLAVICTVDAEGRPEGAVIGFGQTDRLQLIFGTYNSSRKYANIAANPEVSFVIGWDTGVTVQYEGAVRELSGREADVYSEQYFKKSPDSRKYKDHPEERYFLVEPTWIRYTDLRVEPWRILELKF